MSERRRTTRTPSTSPPELSNDSEKKLTASTDSPSTLELLRLKAKIRDLERADGLLRSQLLQQDRQLEELATEIPALAALPSVKYDVPDGSTEVSAVGVLGDWHYGDQVHAEEVQGYNSFNADIADRRMVYWTTKFLSYVESQRRAYTIRECVIIGVGDFVHGMIHLENLIYGEFEPTVAVVRAARTLAQTIRSLAPHFDVVRVEVIATDNHSRLTHKPLYKGRGRWSLGYLLNELVKQQVRDIPNVTFVGHDTLKVDVVVQGRTFLVEHGNDVKAWMGTPFYGIDRLKMREAQRRMTAGLPAFDYLIMGHWHTFATWPGVIINASLVGTTPYDHAAARYSPPSQLGFLVHPRHGVFAMTPFNLRNA